MGTTYQELLDGVASYYGSGSDQWATIARYGVTQQTLPIIQQVPGVTVTVSNSGKFLGYDYNNAFASATTPVSNIDSNVQTGAYGSGSFNAHLPATAVTDPSTGTTTLQSGARAVSGGSVIATIADKSILALVGVSLGTKLGKLIDSGLYAANPDWWDEHYPAINPETWDDIATTEGGKNFIRSIFGLQGDDATMYLDERALAYTYMMLLQNGAYSSGGHFVEAGTVVDDYTIPEDIPMCIFGTGTYGRYNDVTATGGTLYIARRPGEDNNYRIAASSVAPIGLVYNSGTSIYSTNTTSIAYTYNDQTVYYNTNLNLNGYSPDPDIIETQIPSRYHTLIAWAMVYASTSTPELEGVSDNENAGIHVIPDDVINPTTQQPVTPSDDVEDVLQALKNAYPDLFNDSIYEDVPQDDGTTQRITYIPVPYPDTTNQAQPVTDTTPGINPQTAPQINPNTRTEPLLQQLTDTLTQDPVAPDTGGGETPPAVIPTGSANALYSIYNPTQGELNSFGSWLWSSNFVDQLLKLFNDPMQAIIGLHKVFAQPEISGTSTIKVGYLDSGVSSNVVGNQYTTIDCGSVTVSEYFGNVFDYDPFTQIYIYLPFVGIEKLDTGDVMRGNVGVKYHVDVLTGACLAEISITRDGAGGILYTFAGNCAVQYPISSGSYMGIVASLASIAGGVVGTIASGGALAPVAMGAVTGMMNAHARVNHSGAFSGNAGAMGVKKPYLIITRPQTCLANNFPAFDGYPANETTTVSACSGFIKCATCHVENIPATDAELSEIEMLLKGGIII